MRTFAASIALALLAACGQTGDLYLPHKTPQASSQPDEKDKKKETPLPAGPLPDTSPQPSPSPKP